MKRTAWFLAVSLLVLPGAILAEKAQPTRTITVKGLLLDAEGTPVKGQSIAAYPLDPSGAPLDIAAMKDGSIGRWNPIATTDSKGAFAIELPRVQKIGSDEIAELGLGLPIGGSGASLFSGIVQPMERAGEEPEHVIVRKAGNAGLLRKDGVTVKVSTRDPASKIDLGAVSLK